LETPLEENFKILGLRHSTLAFFVSQNLEESLKLNKHLQHSSWLAPPSYAACLEQDCNHILAATLIFEPSLPDACHRLGTRDSTPCVESACYCRYRLQQFVWSPETLCRIFLKKFLKENYDWLRNIRESLKR
jgi:hypothetical protein